MKNILVLGAGHTEVVINGATAFLANFEMRPFLFEHFLPDVLTHFYHFSQDFMAAAVMVMPRSCSWGIQSICASPSCTSPMRWIRPE